MLDDFEKFQVDWVCKNCDKVHNVNLDGDAANFAVIAIVGSLILSDIYPTIFGIDDGYRFEITTLIMEEVLANVLNMN
jgi:hypothetical protein